MRAPCWKQSTGYIPGDLQARHVKYVLNQNQNLRRNDGMKCPEVDVKEQQGTVFTRKVPWKRQK